VILNLLWAALGAGLLGLGLIFTGFCWRGATDPRRKAPDPLVLMLGLASLMLAAFGLVLLLAALAAFVTPEVTP
jgi:hypothetical protein